jgi:hypothetical protein
MEIQFEKFKYPEEIDEQRKLFIECFPENIGTPVESITHYNWKFKSFPSVITAFEYVAKEENEMIGYYAAIPYEYNINGKAVKVAMVCDVMTGIKARGKGIFTKLGVYSTDQFKEEGLAFSTGYPIRPEVIPGHKKAGWSIPFEIPIYGKFLKMNSFLQNKNKSFLVLPANLSLHIYNGFLNLLNFSIKKKPVVETYSAHEIDKIDGLSLFLNEWQKENCISLNKSPKFLKWRLGAPSKEYTIIVQRTDKLIVGYAILRKVIKENVSCIGILDFSILNDYKGFSSILLAQIEKSARNQNAELILVMMMKDFAKKLSLIKNGFLKTPFPFSFIIKQFDLSLDENILFDEKNWNLMWIDSDDL